MAKSPWLTSQRALAGEENGYPSLAQVFGRPEPVEVEDKDGEFLASIRKGAGQAVRDHEARVQQHREYVGGYQRPWPKPLGEAGNDAEIAASHGMPQPEDLPSQRAMVDTDEIAHPHAGMRSLLKDAAAKATALCPQGGAANLSTSGARHMHRLAAEAHGAVIDHAQQMGRNVDVEQHMAMQQYHKDAATWIGQHTAHRFESSPGVTANSAPFMMKKPKPILTKETSIPKLGEERAAEVEPDPVPFRFQSW